MLGVKGLKQLSSKSRGSKHTPYCVVLCSLIGYINRYGKMCFHSMGPNLALVFEVSAQETLAVMPPHRITQSECLFSNNSELQRSNVHMTVYSSTYCKYILQYLWIAIVL